MYFDILFLCDSYEFVLKSNRIPVLDSAVGDWIVLNRNRHYIAFLCEFREVLFLMRVHYYCITFAASLVLYLESCQEKKSKFQFHIIKHNEFQIHVLKMSKRYWPLTIRRTRFCLLFFLWRCNWNRTPRTGPLP